MDANTGTPNDHPPLTPEQMKEKWQNLRIANKLKREVIESRLLESYDYDRAWGGSDTAEFYRMRDQANALYTPVADGSDRKGGAKWPAWRSETDLNRIRQASRICCAQNTYAQGLLRNLTNYVIGTGFKYKVAIKHQHALRWEDDPDGDEMTNKTGKAEFDKRRKQFDQIVKATQAVIDNFCARNNINAEAPPIDEDENGAVDSAASTMEREAYWRVPRDGETFIRMFKHENGAIDVRFVGPEMIYGTPPGQSQADGWYFGVQHQVINGILDLGKVKAYYVRHRELARSSERDTDGDIVPAAEMIHIKDAWEDAEVSRGTPTFSFDMLEALNRAARLQRNMSISSAVRAARAEVWKHMTGTQPQISALQNGPGARTVTDPFGGTRTENAVYPGSISRLPQGIEPVPYSTSTNISDHQMAAQGDLRQACAGVSAPEYMTGTTNDANFATASEAGTPFVLAAESEQAHYKSAFLRLMWRVVRWAVKCGVLPEIALKLIDIEVGGREVKKNNEGELASARKMNLDAKVISPQAEIMKLGGDPAQVMADWKDWQDKMGQIGQPPQGGGGGDGTPDPKRSAASKAAWARRAHGAGGGKKPPVATAVQESAENPDYTYITDPSGLVAVHQALSSATCVGLDLETTSLDPAKGRVRLLSLAIQGGAILESFDEAKVKRDHGKFAKTGSGGDESPKGTHGGSKDAPAPKEHVTKSPAFKAWFGDSKVVDKNGEPLRVFHGTTKDFDEFTPASKSGKTGNPNAQLGYFFSDSPDEANRYAESWGKQGGNLMPVYLVVSNPYPMPYGEFNDFAMAAFRSMTTDPDYDPEATVKFGDVAGQRAAAARVAKHEQIAREQAIARRDELIAEGYDGIVVKVGGAREFIAFNANQVKSATGNSGTFDPKSNKLHESRECRGGIKTFVIDCFAVDPSPLFQKLAAVELAIHHAPFDLAFLEPMAFTPGIVKDTCGLSRVLYPNESHSLSACVQREMGQTLDKALQTSDWSGELTPEQIQYAATDAAVLPHLAAILTAKMRARGLMESFDESKISRADDGKFGHGSGSGVGSKQRPAGGAKRAARKEAHQKAADAHHDKVKAHEKAVAEHEARAEKREAKREAISNLDMSDSVDYTFADANTADGPLFAFQSNEGIAAALGKAGFDEAVIGKVQGLARKGEDAVAKALAKTEPLTEKLDDNRAKWDAWKEKNPRPVEPDVNSEKYGGEATDEYDEDYAAWEEADQAWSDKDEAFEEKRSQLTDKIDEVEGNAEAIQDAFAQKIQDAVEKHADKLTDQLDREEARDDAPEEPDDLEDEPEEPDWDEHDPEVTKALDDSVDVIDSLADEAEWDSEQMHAVLAMHEAHTAISENDPDEHPELIENYLKIAGHAADAYEEAGDSVGAKKIRATAEAFGKALQSLDAEPTPLRESFDESKVKRDGGKFATQAGTSKSKDADTPKADDKPGGSGKSTAVAALASAIGVSAAAYHTIHEAGSEAFHSLPEPVQAVVTKSIAVAFSGWTASQKLAERISVEKGSSPEEAAKLRSILASWDIIAFKPAAIATAPLGGTFAAATWIIPPVTGAYLLHATVTHPLATYRAAKGIIGDAIAAVGKVVDKHTQEL